MAMKKGGLGKGLEALFAENAMEDEGRTVTLPIGEIVPNRAQPRKQFDDEALAELAESIAYTARQKQKGQREDDITVIALQVGKTK